MTQIVWITGNAWRARIRATLAAIRYHRRQQAAPMTPAEVTEALNTYLAQCSRWDIGLRRLESPTDRRRRLRWAKQIRDYNAQFETPPEKPA